jgi:hypothetical protein
MQKFLALVEAMIAHLVDEPATLSSQVREAILKRAATGGSNGSALDTPLAEWVDTIARHAYRTTPEQVTRLRDAGLDEDAIFEATLCASVGAARARLERGLAVIRQGR